MTAKNQNVLLLLVDQVIANALGPYGGMCRTPNLDRLAKSGVTFEYAYTPCSLCSPARASLFTGKLPHEHGILYNVTTQAYGRPDLENQDMVISNPLRRAKVKCGYFGKWHFGQRIGPRECGFTGTSFPGYGLPSNYVEEYDTWLREQGHGGMRDVAVKNVIASDPVDCMRLPMGESMPELSKGGGVYAGIIDLPTNLTPAGFVASGAIEFMEQVGEAPFFLTAAFWGPHHPALPSPEFAGTHAPDSIAAWPNFQDSLEHKPRIQERYARCLHQYFTGASWESWQKVVAAHFDFMSMIDAQIGRILDALEKSGLAENTTVIFTSDHGDTLGCHAGQWDKGPYMFEETYRVPLLIRRPGSGSAGKRATGLVSLIDLFPFMLDTCGAEAPGSGYGINLRLMLDNPDQGIRDCVIGEFHGFDIRGLHYQRMIRMGNFKYVFTPSDLDEFYDLQEDPAELVNLIDEPGREHEIIQLKTRLQQEMIRSGDPFADFAGRLMGL